jgi:cysteine desulfurase
MGHLTRAYFDYNATTPILPEVKKAISVAMDYFGNPSSLHRLGQKARECIDETRELIASKINCKSSQLLFTGSATESNNQVLTTYLNQFLKQSTPVHILYSAIEHSSVRVCIEWMKELGIEADEIEVNEKGIVDLESLRSKLKPHTKLISVMLVNNEIGTIQPIKEIVAIAAEEGIKVHTDGVQALGKINLDVTDLGIDFLSFSGHKIYAPKGIGGLYVKDEHSITPLLHGGGHERRLRAGTENILGIAALKPAFEALDFKKYQSYITPLRDQLLDELQFIDGVCIHNNAAESICNTINVGFEHCDGVNLAMSLDLDGFAVSTGSACSSGSIEPSPVLAAMGVSDSLNKGSLRISLGIYTTVEDIEKFMVALKSAIQQARN